MLQAGDVMVFSWWDYSRMVLHIGFDKLLENGKRRSYEIGFGYTFLIQMGKDDEVPLKVVHGVEKLDLVCVSLGYTVDDEMAIALSDHIDSPPFLVVPIDWSQSDEPMDGALRWIRDFELSR